MVKQIKTKFTKEEIDEFIDSLQNSIGDEKKVKELLHVRSLPIIIAYLKEIGLPEDILSRPSAVEASRIRMIEIFTSPKNKNCVVSDTGIEYDCDYNKGYYRKEKFGLDENNYFRLSKDKYFKFKGSRWKKLYIMNDMETAYDPKIEIRDWDSGRNIDYNMGVLGVKTKSKVIEGIPYVEIQSYLLDGSVEYKKVVDTGLPFFSGNQDSTFEENYEIYTALFPNLKMWYDKCFFKDYRNEDKRTIKEKSDDIDRVITLERLYKINLDIFGLQSDIMSGISNYKNNREKVLGIKDVLQGCECKSDEERECVVSLLKRVQELTERKTDFDDREKMEVIKVELSPKDSVRKYGDLNLDELHQELRGREDKKERLEGTKENISSINEEYQDLLEEVQRFFDTRNGVRIKISDVEELDVNTRLEYIKSELIAKKDNYTSVFDDVATLIMELSNLRAMSITDDWCDKLEDLADKHALRTQTNIDMKSLLNRIEDSNIDNMSLEDNSQMSEEELREYEYMLCEILLTRLDCALFDFEDWKKELERLRGIFIEVRADEIKAGKIKLKDREIVD